MNKIEIKNRLKLGNERYVNDKRTTNKQDINQRKSVVDGQAPFAIVLSCADSRVVPEMIFDTGIGELFVVRVAGNVANTSSIASIEYAVAHLAIKVIVVLGHQNCGAVTAAVNGGDNGYNLNHLLTHIKPAIEAMPKNSSVDEIVLKNAELTAKELTGRSPIIQKAIKDKGIEIIPACYYLDSGVVEFMNE